MKISQFFSHYGISENPFSQEDASTDHVFSSHCLAGVYHPGWDKIFGKPDRPSTSVVFGEKGAGKTALRLQMINELRKYNRENPTSRSFIIEYDDFNPFLDNFRERLHGRSRNAERAVRKWRLWDHMDAILTLGTTKLVDRILNYKQEQDPGTSITEESMQQLTRNERRDVLLLSAFYDRTFDDNPLSRWQMLRRKLSYHNIKSWKELAIGSGVTLLVLIIAIWQQLFQGYWKWILLAIFAGWVAFLWKQAKLAWAAYAVSRQLRVIDRIPSVLRNILSRFPRAELQGQPIPSRNRSDDRYELLVKFQSILKTLGYDQIIVLVDRVDEPHLINGSAERMKDLIWPMFDNKFLKHPGFGFKMLLPSDMAPFLQKQERDFYERSRLDKQNLIMSLNWSGEALYDMTNDRLKACSEDQDKPVNVQTLFDESVNKSQLVDTFSRLRVPRHLFKFFHRLMVDHCSKYTDDDPNWKISRETLQTTLALYQRDLEAFDRGAGTL
ncbi:MAG: hypothetical protein CMJ47_02465 [Planctomyces sp.]|uniref:Uncharacterized protein n=1 Tax=Rubinisphaera brasiliensis (strain ATCC 49424 / DSM 5305 / JCM 21570 / IAM 15109 / NBRC 103401 / IFAM 1448) TaxID=756272 RepID=F0SGN4_RUBBR|nr:hypothetical protein [Rubinisphaera brasiliensis]ADY61639.1 hypothetical protein Plabr_4062 [Rubinisphaera brasiliensis DSM 5305]MBB01488.1 hypothetical protein [Planctomyces sp.]